MFSLFNSPKRIYEMISKDTTIMLLLLFSVMSFNSINYLHTRCHVSSVSVLHFKAYSVLLVNLDFLTLTAMFIKDL